MVPLAITGLGMVCSIGDAVEGACAAARAGIVRTSPLRSFRTLDADGGDDLEPILVHAMTGRTEGFHFTGLWTCIAHACIGDLTRNALLLSGDRRFLERMGVIVIVPVLDPDRYLLENAPGPEALLEEFARPLLGVAGLPIEDANIRVLCGGEGDVAQAVQMAGSAIERAEWDRAIVLAVDSLCDLHSVEWLASQGRLKGPAVPAGLMPGEASAAFLLESEQAASTRGAAPVGWLNSSFLAKSATDVASAQEVGQSLATLGDECLKGAGLDGDVVANCNGENWRAMALAAALLQLKIKGYEARRCVFPAESIGDVGVASGTVGVCVATRALARGYASGSNQLVLALSNGGGLGALLVSHQQVQR